MTGHLFLLWLAILACSSIALASPRCDTCPRDQHGHIQRHASTRTAFKHQHPCPATGKPRGACPGYVIDHIVALKRGGADSPDNMQWQTIADARAKDRWE